jgi:hypothetical protein
MPAPMTTTISRKAKACLVLALLYSMPFILLGGARLDGPMDTVTILLSPGGLLGLAILLLAIHVAKRVWQRREAPAGLWLAGMAASLVLYANYLILKSHAERMADADQDVVRIILHNLAKGLLQYAKTQGTLPPAAVYGPEGKPLLSWRVLLLPYLEEQGRAEPGLFARFRLDEPWDSPHNKALLSKMPDFYTPPESPPTLFPYTTRYRVFVGPGTAFEGTQGIRLEDFSDGRDQTFLIVEAGEAVPWTKPEELTYGPGQPLPSLYRRTRNKFVAAMADGRTHSLPFDTPKSTLQAWVTRNGGETVGPEAPGQSRSER